MSEAPHFYEIFPLSLRRHGEELCGDEVKYCRLADRTIVVLSDGLGSGIKAAILARLTTEIIVTMLRAEAPLREVIETVTGTLPISREHGLAYSTFVILQIRNRDGWFQLSGFDSPPAVLVREQRPQRLESRSEVVGGKPLMLSEGVLLPGDFLGLMSDGVLHASPGVTRDPAWGWEAVAACLGKAALNGAGSAEFLVRAVMTETRRRYGERVGDDATFVGVLARQPRRLMVFTGPPTDRGREEACVNRLLSFEGRRVVCGGTTAQIVAEHSGEVLRTDESTRREGIPPIGVLPDLDLVTEGILTMARALELLKTSQGNPQRLAVDRNGAVLLAREFLQADSIVFLAGESVNPYYQNPQLPRSVSIRRSLVTQLVETLRSLQKVVSVEWV